MQRASVVLPEPDSPTIAVQDSGVDVEVNLEEHALAAVGGVKTSQLEHRVPGPGERRRAAPLGARATRSRCRVPACSARADHRW